MHCKSYEHGVNTFDTANIYSNGVSEVYLGRAIKTLNLPRGEIVVMTKVMWLTRPKYSLREVETKKNIVQVYGAVARTAEANLAWTPAAELEKMGYVNQRGLSRKVGDVFRFPLLFPVLCFMTLCICSTFSIL